MASSPSGCDPEHPNASEIQATESVQIDHQVEVSLVVDQVLEDRSERLGIIAFEKPRKVTTALPSARLMAM